MQSFVEQIQYGIENHLEADEATVWQWEMVKTKGRLTNNRTEEAVEPLLTTTWDQGPPYSLFVPDGCLTGCTATAMAQVMKYWNWPVQGTGEHSYEWNGYILSANFGETTYDWDNMIDCYYCGVQATQEQREAVATLMWHCGVSVEMNYSPDWSGALLFPSSLIDYFNYSDEMSMEYHNDYSDASWKAKLKDCLNLGRPLYYVGCSLSNGSICHAFVCDGYDTNEMFHFNWGWSGSSDGYYALGALNVGGYGYQYNYTNQAIFNTHPSCDEPTVYEINVSVSNDEGGSVSGSGTFTHGDTVTLSATADEGYCFQYWMENGGVASTDPNYSFPANFNRNLAASFTGPVTISVSASEGGTVSGGGNFCYEACEVTATPNEGYNFSNWTENGDVVSVEANYNFIVTGERHLTANFVPEGIIVFADMNVKALCVANWDTDGDGELSVDEAGMVTSLGYVFTNNSDITSFDEFQYFTNLTTINDYAFYGCHKLTSIILPNSVAVIGSSAFCSCFSLKCSLIIPNTVISINSQAFSDCSGLTGSLTIPNSVTTIGYRAFQGCSGLTGSLNIPNSITSISSEAFSGCRGLTGSLTIPSTVTTIGSRAFINCSGFTGCLTIPNSVTSIGDNPFSGCYGLEQIIVELGNAVYDSRGNCNAIIYTSTNQLISGCKNTIIPSSVTSIGNYAFYNCQGLTGVLDISNSVISIGSSAFYDCNGLTGSLDIPNSVTSIGIGAFQGCSGLISLTIPSSITTISGAAFNGCSGLTSLTIPNSVTSFGISAFRGCTGLTSLTIPNAVTSIGNYAFYNCRNLESVIMLSPSVPTLGSNAFSGTNANCYFYVPYPSLEDYKTAAIWSNYEHRIFPMAYASVPGYGNGDDKWVFIASPLSEDIVPSAIDNMLLGTNYDLYQFNQSATDEEWQNYKVDSFNLVNGHGYVYANESEVNVIFKGEFNEDETKEVSLDYDAEKANTGWNLVGNPFPVDAYIDRPYYVMNEDGTAINPIAVPASIPIPPCTGVMVKANGIGESVTFSKIAPGTRK